MVSEVGLGHPPRYTSATSSHIRTAYSVLQIGQLGSQLVDLYVQVAVLVLQKGHLLLQLAPLLLELLPSADASPSCDALPALHVAHVLLLRPHPFLRNTRNNAADRGRTAPVRRTGRYRPQSALYVPLFPFQQQFLPKVAIAQGLHPFFLRALCVLGQQRLDVSVQFFSLAF